MNPDDHTPGNNDVPINILINYRAPAGLILAICAGLYAAISGPGTRWGWWHFTTGFIILRRSAVAGLVAATVSVTGGIMSGRQIRRAGVAIVVAGLLIGSVVAGVPVWWMQTAHHLRRIHDIATNMDNPPRFVSILSLRKDAPYSPEYGGPKTAQQQRAA
jgi:hypothetical protein